MAEAIFKVLIDNLTSLIREKVGLLMGVDKEMKKLSSTLTTIQTVLEDAEDKQFENKTIKNWVGELNGIACEIEDILDDCNTEMLRLKRKGGRFNLKKVLFKYNIGRRIKEAAEKLEFVAQSRRFHLDETVLRQSKLVDWRRETGFVLNDPDHIYGRDDDREKIVDVLVNQVKDCEQLSVLPIVGIGGMGKTTLAQFVYNDERVSLRFDTKLWVCVSDDFDLKAILRAIIQDKSNLEDLNSLQLRLRQELSGKKYLLILDDVWNDNQEDWFKLKSILACGSMGASIVVTTRLKKVADIMGTLPSHCLSQLSDEDCWLLFKLRAFGQESEQCVANLESIGRRIVKKCYGVPLAAKALGGLLRFNKDGKEWVRVEESQMWNLSEAESSILAVLRLSYRNLPFMLKSCFIHCALFPKDYVFGKTELMFHWIAHGCISSDGEREVEEVGDHVWNELALRSFFQEIDGSAGEITFKMHDLVHDLAQSIMENRVHGAETKSRNKSSASASNSKIRQVRWITRYSKTRYSSIAAEVSTLTTIINYHRLRSLNLLGLKMEELPDSIGKLKQLRYLDLSFSSIRSLPRTFCRLYNLQILKLGRCRHLKSLPKNIIYMSSLNYMDLRECDSLIGMPYRIGKLVSLKTLNLFIVGDKKGNQLDELEELNLGGRLEIKHLERVKEHTNAKKANLKGKPNLRDLVFQWEDNEESSEMMDGEKVLEALEPDHLNLTTLKIIGFKSRNFASWIKDMRNLTKIVIMSCRNCIQLPPLGHLPLLKLLILEELDALEYIDVEMDAIGCPIFPSMEKLILSKLPNLKGLLNEKGAGDVGEMYPNLQRLKIKDCPSSTFVSSGLKSLKELSCFARILSSFNWKFRNLSSLEVDFEVDFGETYGTRACNYLPLEGLCNLKKLSVQRASLGSVFREGWSRHLPALKELRIEQCQEFEAVMAEELKHLHLLKTLYLFRVPDIVSLPQALRHLPSLQCLQLHSLRQLTSLPEWLPELKSLTQLHITFCPNIPSLPPAMKEFTSLKSLWIQGCPKLERLCEEPNGEDWPNIAHIPYLHIAP